ncbi:MAG: hypothetical protein JWO46_3460 [Nocardioidaceae bacterium]|nr:hypothetical protein [Nocardioidaceae bacterium]
MTEPDDPSDRHAGDWVGTLRGLSQGLAVPHGFTLSAGGALAIMVERDPDPGPVALWLFVVAASIGFCLITVVSGAHRSRPARPVAISGLALLNLTPVVVVPVAVLAGWWIASPALAFPVVGLVTVVGYLVSLATAIEALDT